MADNNNMDMNRLRQDAIRRAREMQTRALGTSSVQKNQVQNNETPPVPEPPLNSEPPAEHHQRTPKSGVNSRPGGVHIPVSPNYQNMQQSNPHQVPQASPVKDIFESLLGGDSERTLLVVLILLLVQENADTGLIFALMYLVL